MAGYDIVALGELLIDFTENGNSKQGNPLMEANPGGAPCNVLAMMTKLGKKTAFIGKVGNDIWGNLLINAISEVGIDDRGLKQDKEVNTTLAFVHTHEDGDREFSFYRNPGADMMLKEEDLDIELIRDCKVFHYGTLSMTHEECRKASFKAIEIAKENGAIISFDPNLRESLWDNLDDAREQILAGMEYCDILKISDNEIIWLTGEEDFDKGIKWIRDRFPGIKLMTLSMGRDGSRAVYKDMVVDVPAYLQENTIETTGAGDTFCGSVLSFCIDNDLDNLTEEGIRQMLHFANAAASIVTTRKGALRVMPEKEEVVAMIQSRQ